MPLTGDFAALRELEADLSRFKFGDIVKATGAEVFDQYQADFAGQRDPWGSAWAVGVSGHTPVLYRSGRLANPQITVGSANIRLKPETYWIFHQVGANGAQQKAVVPFGEIDGTVWAAPMKAAVEGEMARQLGAKP